MEAVNRQWRLVSYHPHSGGGGPQWDPMIHGFHTYFTELIAEASDPGANYQPNTN
jgi:hypothetical protein